jgi:hypothetical protein
VGLVAYFLGHSAGGAIEAFGVYGLVAVAVAILSTFILHRRHAAHVRQAQNAAPSGGDPALPGPDPAPLEGARDQGRED